MVSLREVQKSDISFDFLLSHGDILSMLLDSDVNANGGNIADNQEFQILIERQNGSQIFLKNLTETDTLVIRFKTVTESESDTPLNGVDVS